MTYPQSTEYQAAVQHPQQCFVDPELKSCATRMTPLGLPYALSGGFALTYTLERANRKYAVRCFHREVNELHDRYEKISNKLKSIGSEFFVDFSYKHDGIIVNSQKFPIVKMDWVEGDTLGEYINNHHSNTLKMRNLRDQFRKLNKFLDANKIAHGDIQDLNVLCKHDRIVLIDYDGMFVEGMQPGFGNEIGHKDYQHSFRNTAHFGPDMDHFSFILIDLTLSIIIERPDIFKKFKSGGEALLFKANDYKNPNSSLVFQECIGISALTENVKHFRSICLADISRVPSLADYLRGSNIPSQSSSPPTSSTKAPPIASYISSYEVLDATQYKLVEQCVGAKIELVGKIVSVRKGTGKYGRGKGKPYVFLNFGKWQEPSVKITIWSEGLDNFQKTPGDELIGQWVSVVGLIDEPYHGKTRYGKPYENISITVERERQFEVVTTKDAKYRLTKNASRSSQTTTNQPTTNQAILQNLHGASASPKMTPPPAQRQSQNPSQKTGLSSNQQILANITPTPSKLPPTKQKSLKISSSPYQPHLTKAHIPKSKTKSISWLYWAIGIGTLILIIARGG